MDHLFLMILLTCRLAQIVVLVLACRPGEMKNPARWDLGLPCGANEIRQLWEIDKVIYARDIRILPVAMLLVRCQGLYLHHQANQAVGRVET